MPPFHGTWWWNKNFIAMTIGLVGIFFAGYQIMVHVASRYGGTVTILCSLALVAAIVAWIRLLATVAVRSSIQQGVVICLQHIHDYNVVAIVGFSWGGAVLAELLVQGVVGYNETQPAALLIAPATALVASIAMRKDAAFRVEAVQHLVHVVHATDDRHACPHPERWEHVGGVKYTLLQDIHIFRERASKRALSEIMMQLLEQQAASQNESVWVDPDNVIASIGETTPTQRRPMVGISEMQNLPFV
jgi:hypothetical protein